MSRSSRLSLVVALAGMLFVPVQADPPDPGMISEDAPPPLPAAATTAQVHPPAPVPVPGSMVGLQTALEKLAQENRDLLDILKKQQDILQEIQYDRRLQSRQIRSLEERLQQALLQNTQLQNRLTSMALNLGHDNSQSGKGGADNSAPAKGQADDKAQAKEDAPPPPGSTLPKASAPGAPGDPWWHRILTLNGTDGTQTQLFKIEGKRWRVLWHNADPAGKNLANTSALFINAFPKDDTIPQKVSAKLGTGGDTTELQGPGQFYLKVEASGGSWELAVEDFH